MLGFTFIELLRSELSKLGPWWWMLWNAMLALIPVGLTMVFFKRSEQEAKKASFWFVCQVVIVMLFLPNAPYVATDMIHFVETVRESDRDLWHLLATEFPLYMGFVLLGLVSYAFATDRLLYALKARAGRSGYLAGLLTIPLLSSIGIYLGRVARFNSWDILSQPFSIARSSKEALLQVKVVEIVLVMAVLLMLVHLSYKIFHDGLRVRLEKLRQESDSFAGDGAVATSYQRVRAPEPAADIFEASKAGVEAIPIEAEERSN